MRTKGGLFTKCVIFFDRFSPSYSVYNNVQHFYVRQSSSKPIENEKNRAVYEQPSFPAVSVPELKQLNLLEHAFNFYTDPIINTLWRTISISITTYLYRFIRLIMSLKVIWRCICKWHFYYSSLFLLLSLQLIQV